MTAPIAENQEKISDKELNFRKQEMMFQRQLEQERAARLEAERKLEEANRKPIAEEEEDDEPYVDKRKLEKKLAHFGQQTQKQTQNDLKKTKEEVKEELKQEMWLEKHPDFNETIEKYANQFAEKYPGLATTILHMPEGFNRHKLVYQNIKELGLDKPEVKEPSIQEKIEANRRSPFYQPSNIGNPAMAGPQGDFSQSGQKAAYDKMQELKSRLRI